MWLESVAILPQLFMLQRTGEAETITVHYLFALGIYRALYIPNWIYRYFAEGHVDPIPVIAGIIQTILYSDFFYIYYTKWVVLSTRSGETELTKVECFRAKSSTCLIRRGGMELRGGRQDEKTRAVPSCAAKGGTVGATQSSAVYPIQCSADQCDGAHVLASRRIVYRPQRGSRGTVAQQLTSKMHPIIPHCR